MLVRNKNIKLILNYIVGPLVFCILIYSIYRQIQKQTDWQHSIEHIGNVFHSGNSWKLLLAFALMFVNWGIEARKWQVALAGTANVSFLTSFKAVLSGTTMAFFTPNRMGEYVGRVLYLEEGKRISGAALTIVSSIAQLLVTLVAGVGGLLFITSCDIIGPNVIFWINLMIYIVTACAIVLTIFYFRLSWLVKWIRRWPMLDKLANYMALQGSLNATILFRMLSLSVTRYMVFIAQYFLLFGVFGVELGWWQTFWSVSVVFLVIAVVPSIAVLTELGIRWKTSIGVLQLFTLNTAGILATSLSVWLINLVVPALLGSLLIFGLKLFRNT